MPWRSASCLRRFLLGQARRNISRRGKSQKINVAPRVRRRLPLRIVAPNYGSRGYCAAGICRLVVAYSRSREGEA